jgi:hypothetical protein
MEDTMLIRLYSRELALLFRLAAAERVAPAELASRLVARGLHPLVKEWGGPNHLPSLEEALRTYGDDGETPE